MQKSKRHSSFAFYVSVAQHTRSPTLLFVFALLDSYNFTVRLTHSREPYQRVNNEGEERKRERYIKMLRETRVLSLVPLSVLHKDQSIKNAKLHEINPLNLKIVSVSSHPCEVL